MNSIFSTRAVDQSNRLNATNLVATTLLILLSTVASVTALAAATVSFNNVDAYREMPFSHSDRDDVLKELQRHFDKLAEKLPAGQQLKISVIDIGLAGRVEPHKLAGHHDVRVLRGGADWPMMKFTWQIEANSKVQKSGQADINDMNYLRGFNRYNASEPLRHEKKMLDDWFRNAIIEK